MERSDPNRRGYEAKPEAERGVRNDRTCEEETRVTTLQVEERVRKTELAKDDESAQPRVGRGPTGDRRKAPGASSPMAYGSW